MTATTITNFRKNLFKMVGHTIKYNEPINVLTKEGEAVVINKQEYDNMLETIYLTSIPGMEKKIKEGLDTSLEDCATEDEVEW